MPKVEIKQETLDFLQGLVKEINKQDRRATASPYYYVIQADRLVEDQVNGETYYFDDEGGHLGTREEAIGSLTEQGYLESNVTPEDADAYLEDYCRSLDMSYQKTILQGPVFLTEKAINEHLRLNQHHYGKTARNYIDHFWRNPEMERLFKAIADVSGIDLDGINRGRG